jgi:putative endonuclease
MGKPCVYMLASARNGTLYVGVTNNLIRRVFEHRSDSLASFTKQYAVHLLVYVEFHETMPLAIAREKQIKKWRRDWKIRLIERANPSWRDLHDELAAG